MAGSFGVLLVLALAFAIYCIRYLALIFLNPCHWLTSLPTKPASIYTSGSETPVSTVCKVSGCLALPSSKILFLRFYASIDPLDFDAIQNLC